MLLGELLLGQLAGVVPGNPRRSLFCVAMPLALRGDSFHTASVSPTSNVLKMYPAYRLRCTYFAGCKSTPASVSGGCTAADRVAS